MQFKLRALLSDSVILLRRMLRLAVCYRIVLCIQAISPHFVAALSAAEDTWLSWEHSVCSVDSNRLTGRRVEGLNAEAEKSG